MFAKINHVAIVSENYSQLSRFYQAFFHMTDAPYANGARAVMLGDGYVGLNINPRQAGRPAGLDHFGIQVEDVETVFERMRNRFPDAQWLKRPSTRPFAGISANDPDGNIFDISQKDMTNRKGIYVANNGDINDRFISHIGLRTRNPDKVAEFYSEVFELSPANKAEGDVNHYLSDGHVTLVIMPWNITDYEGTGIIRAGMDHIGFTVESLDAFTSEMEKLSAWNYHLAPVPMKGAEGICLGKLFDRTCPIGDFKMADSDGILINVFSR